MESERKLQINRVDGPGGCLVRLTGVIDETFDSRRLVEGLEGAVVFDLDGVHRITSYGVREWVSAFRDVQLSYSCFVRCRPAVVAQFNMVAGFGGRGELISFYAPYVCPKCGRDVEVLIDLRKQFSQVKAYSPPPVKCPSCGAFTQFDDIPESFFDYAASMPQPAPPPMVEQLLNSSVEMGPPLRVEKEVQGTLTALWFSGGLDRSTPFKRLADGLEGTVLTLFGGITRVGAEGLAGLAGFLRTPGVRLYLGRVPPPLLEAFVADPRVMGDATLLSIRLPFTCQSCRRGSGVDVNAELIESILSGAGPKCPYCSAGLQPDPGVRLESLRGLTLGQPPEEVLSYLHAHTQTVTLTPPVRGATEIKQRPVETTHTSAPAPSTTPVPSASSDPLDPAATRTSTPFGRYQLLRPIGAGGMAEVFLARQTGLGGFEKHVVVKRILPNLSVDHAFVEMFLQEARLAARISHPNVVQIFDVGQVGAQYFMAMEYVRGWDLNAVLRLCLRLGTPFPVELGAAVVAHICAGLQAAHSATDEHGRPAPIIHRDVSPHNVLVSTDGQVKLTDFGIAKALEGGSRTPTATLKGKLSYMSPEQVRADGSPMGPRSDLFPAALILYQCLTLEQPFRRESEFATLKAILQDPVPSVSTRRNDVPPSLDRILERGLARDPEQRYPSGRALQQDLEKLIAEVGKPAGAAELATWLGEMIHKGEAMGQLPADMGFTPTGGSRSGNSLGDLSNEETAVTPPLKQAIPLT